MYSDPTLNSIVPFQREEFCTLCQAFHPPMRHIVSEGLMPVFNQKECALSLTLDVWSPNAKAFSIRASKSSQSSFGETSSSPSLRRETLSESVVGSIFERCICGAVGSLGGGFGYHGCRNLVFCDYYGVIYRYVGWAEVLRTGLVETSEQMGRWQSYVKYIVPSY